MPAPASQGRKGHGLWRPRTSPQDGPRDGQGKYINHVHNVTVACLYKGGQTMCSQVIAIDPNQHQILKVIRKKAGVADTADKLRENRLHWFVHVKRRPENAPMLRVEEWDHGGVKRGRERPKMTWLQGVRKDMKCKDLHEDEALDRKGWRRKIYVDDYTE